MELKLQGEHIYAGEHLNRTLHITVENAYADKTVKLAFVTPAGKFCCSEALTLSNGEADYLLPFALLDAKGTLQVQIHVTDAGVLCAKSRVWFLEVERSVDGGDAFDGDRLLSLADLVDSYSDLKTRLDQLHLSAVASSGAYADLTGRPDLSVYARSSEVAADIVNAKQNVNDRFIITAQYNFTTGVIGSFDVPPENWNLNNKKALVLRLTDGTRTFDLTGEAKTNFFVERRLLTGVIPMKTVLGQRHIIPDASVQPFAFAVCVLGFDDSEPTGGDYAYLGRRSDGIWVWIGKVCLCAQGVLSDDTTGDQYRLGVDGGLLYIEEV